MLAHVPLPEKELGIAGEILALGWVCYAITAPRLDADRAIAAASVGAVTEAERITAQHAQAPYAQGPLDNLARAAGETSEELYTPTVGATDPDIILRVDELARQVGITPETVAGMRHELGDDTPLLDVVAPAPTYGPNQEPAPREHAG